MGPHKSDSYALHEAGYIDSSKVPPLGFPKDANRVPFS